MTGILHQPPIGWSPNPMHGFYETNNLPSPCLELAHVELDLTEVTRPNCYDCGDFIDDVSAAQRMVACENGCHVKFRCESCKNTRKVVKTWEVPSLPVRIPSVLV